MRVGETTRALVTGAASGTGLALSLALARQGASLWLVDIDEPGLAAATEQAQEAGAGQIIAEVCDLAQPEQIDRLVERIEQTWTSLNLLINNAGVCYHGPLHRMSDEQWDRVLAVNLDAPVRLSRRCLSLLRNASRAHVVNMCSIFGLVGYRKTAAYQTSKFALVGFSEALRVELMPDGIGVTAVCPGFIRDTAFFDSMMSSRSRRHRPPAWVCCTSRQVADRTLKAVRRNRGLIVITPLARVLWWANRFSPSLVDRTRRLMRSRRSGRRDEK